MQIFLMKNASWKNSGSANLIEDNSRASIMKQNITIQRLT